MLLATGAEETATELDERGATLDAADDTLTACDELTTGAELIAGAEELTATSLELEGSLVPVQPASAADINTASGIIVAFMVSPLLLHLCAVFMERSLKEPCQTREPRCGPVHTS